MTSTKTKIFNGIRLVFKNRFGEFLLRNLNQNAEFGLLQTKLVPNHYQYKQGSVRKIRSNGINYYLDISDIVDWFIYFGFAEKSRMKLLEMSKGSMCILDVGANIGAVSLGIAKTTRSDNIWAFEPDPINYKRLIKNLSMNQELKINPVNIGLGSKKAKLKLATVDENNRGMNRVVSDSDKYRQVIEIEILPLDIFWSSHINLPVDLLKIDVEGYEYEVLLGARGVIEKFHPRLFIELDDKNLRDQGSSAKQVVGLLEDWGYSLSHSETGLTIDSDKKFDNCHFDVVALVK